MANSSFESQNVPFAYVDKRVGGGHGLFGGKETAVLTRALTAPELAAKGLYEQAVAAAADNDLDRSRTLIEIASSLNGQANLPGGWHGSRPEDLREPREFGHYGRMDAWRLIVSMIIVFALAAVVILAVASGKESNITQYSAPISGLAGIALGWLFTSNAARPFPSRYVTSAGVGSSPTEQQPRSDSQSREEPHE